MNKKTATGLLALAMATAGIARADVAKPRVLVVAGAKTLSVVEKGGVTGQNEKPGYGFGAPVHHYGPPGQGYTGDPNQYTWRQSIRDGLTTTPKGNDLPPHAFVAFPWP